MLIINSNTNNINNIILSMNPITAMQCFELHTNDLLKGNGKRSVRYRGNKMASSRKTPKNNDGSVRTRTAYGLV